MARPGKYFDLGYDLVICALQGMALNMLRHRATEPNQDLLRYLEQQVDDLGAPRAATMLRPLEGAPDADFAEA
jgi:hypothetical protein